MGLGGQTFLIPDVQTTEADLRGRNRHKEQHRQGGHGLQRLDKKTAKERTVWDAGTQRGGAYGQNNTLVDLNYGFMRPQRILHI